MNSVRFSAGHQTATPLDVSAGLQAGRNYRLPNPTGDREICRNERDLETRHDWSAAYCPSLEGPIRGKKRGKSTTRSVESATRRNQGETVIFVETEKKIPV